MKYLLQILILSLPLFIACGETGEKTSKPVKPEASESKAKAPESFFLIPEIQWGMRLSQVRKILEQKDGFVIDSSLSDEHVLVYSGSKFFGLPSDSCAFEFYRRRFHSFIVKFDVQNRDSIKKAVYDKVYEEYGDAKKHPLNTKYEYSFYWNPDPYVLELYKIDDGWVFSALYTDIRKRNF